MVEFLLLPATLGVGLFPISIAKGLIRPPRLKIPKKRNNPKKKCRAAGWM